MVGQTKGTPTVAMIIYIFEAIRYLRQEKGTTAKKILTYVQERMGKDMKIRGYLKVTEALNRLVEDGLLLKKGDKYMLPWPCTPNENGKSDEIGKGDGDGMDDDDEDEDEEDEDEDEDEEDEDEDEDEDDEDDEDEDCPDEEDEKKNGKTNGKTNGNGKANQEQKPNRGGNEGECNTNGNEGQMDQDASGSRFKDSEWSQKHIHILKKNLKSELNPKFMSNRGKKQKRKQFRSDMYDVFDDDDYASLLSSRRNSSTMMDQGLPESGNDAQLNNCHFSLSCDLEGFDTCRYRSPNGSPPPNTPGVHEPRKESCSSDISTMVDDSKKTEPEIKSETKIIKREPTASRQSLDRSKERQGKRRDRDGGEENGKAEKITKRDPSFPKSKVIKQGSLCLHCRNKKEEACDQKPGNW